MFLSRLFPLLACAGFLVAGAGAVAARDMATTTVSGTLAPLDNVMHTDALEASDIYAAYPAPAFYGGGDTFVGSGIDLAGAGPQATISGIRLIVYAQRQAAYQHVVAQIKFWNGFNAAANPVFSDAALLVNVEVTGGPFNMNAGQAYQVTVPMPVEKPPQLDGMMARGVSVNVLVDYGNGVLAPTPDLVPALDTGSHPANVGVTLGSYGNGGRLQEDLNFLAANHLSQTLAIGIQGSGTKLVQCGNWPGYSTTFSEEFDSSDGFTNRWDALTNGSSHYGVGDGKLALSAPSSAGFVYVNSKGTPIPGAGEFSVRWLARYDAAASYGTASMVISRGLPPNGSADNLQPRAAWVWQDTTQNFHVKVKTDYNTPNPAATFQESAGTNAIHDIEYCWLASTVELWVDGVKKLAAARNANVLRPDSLWIGNHTIPGPGNWSDLTVFRVQVRTESIFIDGFQ